MHRKILALVSALCLVTAILAGCGGGNTSAGSGGSTSGTSSQDRSASDSGSSSSSGSSGSSSGSSSSNSSSDSSGPFVFQTPNGSEVTIGEDMADVLSEVGKEQSYFEAASCAFEGLDKTYTYSGFVITTRPDGEKDYVNSIRLTDDSVTTPEGSYIGSSLEDVQSTYGEGTLDGAQLTYQREDTILSFILESDKVTSIEYLPAE